MTNEEKELARRFCGAEIGAEDFRSRFRPGVSDAGLPVILIGEALADRDASALELAIASLSRLRTRFPLEALESVLFETWHFSHEDIVRMIADLREPKAIPALVKMVHWVPDYLMWDMESRAMARKAVDGLGWLMDHASAREELELLVGSKWEVLRETAIRFLGENAEKIEARHVRSQVNSGVFGLAAKDRKETWDFLTDGEFELVRKLLDGGINSSEFISCFRPAITEGQIASLFIEEAISKRNDEILSRAIALLTRLRASFPLQYLQIVLYETWHTSHEDLVDMLTELRDTDAIPDLVKMAHWVPDHLMWDIEDREMSRKAVYGLGWLKDHPAAHEELERIAGSEWEPLRRTAFRFLENKQ